MNASHKGEVVKHALDGIAATGIAASLMEWNPLNANEDVFWQTSMNEPYPMDPYDFIEFEQAMRSHQIATTQRAILIKAINEARLNDPSLGPPLDPKEDWVWTDDLNEGDL